MFKVEAKFSTDIKGYGHFEDIRYKFNFPHGYTASLYANEFDVRSRSLHHVMRYKATRHTFMYVDSAVYRMIDET